MRRELLLVLALSTGPRVAAVRLPPLPWRRQQAALQAELDTSRSDGKLVDDAPVFSAGHAEEAVPAAAPPTAAERAAVLRRRLALAELEQERLELEAKELRLQMQMRELKRGVVPQQPPAADRAGEARAPSGSQGAAHHLRSLAAVADAAKAAGGSAGAGVAAGAGQNASGAKLGLGKKEDERIESLVASMQEAIDEVAGGGRGDADGEQVRRRRRGVCVACGDVGGQ